MTKAQQQKVDKIRRMAETLHGHLSDEYEIKEWEVEESDYGTVSVSFTIGGKGDEGTLAEIFARDHGLVFIGKRGGMTYYNHKGKKLTRKRWDGRCLYTLTLAN